MVSKKQNESCPDPRKIECTKPKCPQKPSSQQPVPCLPKKQESILEMPHFLRIIGPRQIQIALSYVPSLIRYGVASAVALFYVTDFKTLLQYLPYYNGKYKVEEDEKAKPSKDEEHHDEEEGLADEGPKRDGC